MDEKKDLKFIPQIKKSDIITDRYGFRVASIDESYKTPPTLIEDMEELTGQKGNIEYFRGLSWRTNYPIKWTPELTDQVFQKFKKYAKKAGGRPKKESKSKELHLKLTKEEYEKFETVLKDSKEKYTAQKIKEIVFKRKITLRHEDVNLKKLTWEIAKIGTNVNQIAHICNMQAEKNEPLTKEILESLNRIEAELYRVLDKKEEEIWQEKTTIMGKYNEMKNDSSDQSGAPNVG